MLFIYFSIFVKSKDRLKMEKSAVDVYRRGGCVLVIVAYSRLLTVSMALRGPACVVCMLGCCSTFFKPAILQPRGLFTAGVLQCRRPGPVPLKCWCQSEGRESARSPVNSSHPLKCPLRPVTWHDAPPALSWTAHSSVLVPIQLSLTMNMFFFLGFRRWRTALYQPNTPSPPPRFLPPVCHPCSYLCSVFMLVCFSLAPALWQRQIRWVLPSWHVATNREDKCQPVTVAACNQSVKSFACLAFILWQFYFSSWQ